MCKDLFEQMDKSSDPRTQTYLLPDCIDKIAGSDVNFRSEKSLTCRRVQVQRHSNRIKTIIYIRLINDEFAPLQEDLNGFKKGHVFEPVNLTSFE